MFVIKYRNWFFALTGLIVLLSLISLAVFRLHESIDFTGGTLAQISYEGPLPSAQALTQQLTDAGIKDFSLRQYGTDGYTLRAQTLTPQQEGDLASYFTDQQSTAHVDSLNEIGPSISSQLKSASIEAIIVVLVCILLFIAFAFRKVSKPVSSWTYGLIALVTLLHDVVVPAGFFALLGYLTGAQVDTLFVTALLTVLGFSVHDTIVVFDRVRENLRINQDKGRREDFAQTAGRALSQTFTRSINTSLTVLLTLLALYFLGPQSTQVFALTLLVGIIAGTYSSIFLATPLLVEIEARRRK